jgi:hypothetical protein
MRREAGLGLFALSSALIACGCGSDGAPARGVAVPISAPAVVSSPPTPAATDWKGLFDSDLQIGNAPPAPETAAEVLRHEPACTRVDTFTSGAFTSTNGEQTAYLLSCGATRRVVLVADQSILATRDVSEDVLEDAGDLDLDGRHELVLYGHAGPTKTVRVLRFDAGKLSSIYAFSPTPDPCVKTIVYYRFMTPNVEYRVDEVAKRCTP